MEGTEPAEPRFRAPHVTLTKRSGVYQISYYWRGKQYRKTTRLRTKSQAQALQQSLQLRLRTAYHVNDPTFEPYSQPERPHTNGDLPHEVVTLGHVFDIYRRELLHLSERHRVVQGHRLDFIEKRLGGRNVPITAITTEVIKSYVEERRQDGVTETSISNEVVCLTRACHLGMAQDPPLLVRMPFKLVNPPKPSRFSSKVLPPEVAKLLLSRLDPGVDTDRCCLCALVLGLRSRDLTQRLSWEHVDFEKGVVTITTSKTKAQISNPVPQHVLEKLRPYAQPSGLVCPVRNPSVTIPRRVKGLLGRPYSLHRMRAAYITALDATGASLALTAKLSGHAVKSLTSAGYIHPDDHAKREAVGRISYLQPEDGAKKNMARAKHSR